MELTEVIRERRSFRAFKKDPVPRETIEAILKLTTMAPSAINIQPWEFVVVSGEERERLSRRLIKAYREKRIPCAPGAKGPLPQVLTRRGEESFKRLKSVLDELKLDFDEFINEGSLNFYGAPTAILIFIDSVFSQRRYVDCGIALGYLLLASHEFGLGTCPIGLICAYEEEVKEVLNVPENKNLVIGVAIGYPDMENPVNSFRSLREDLDSFVRWIE